MVKPSLLNHLVLAVDFLAVAKFNFIAQTRDLIRQLQLCDTEGVTLKFDSPTLSLGFDSIWPLVPSQFGIFLDAKLASTPDSHHRYACDLRANGIRRVDMITVMCNSGVPSMEALREYMPKTKVFGVTLLSSVTEEGCIKTYREGRYDTVKRFSEHAVEAKLHGVICPPDLIGAARSVIGSHMEIATPGIRLNTENKGNHFTVAKPFDAICDGARYIIMGRDVVHLPDDALRTTVHEIAIMISNGLKAREAYSRLGPDFGKINFLEQGEGR